MGLGPLAGLGVVHRYRSERQLLHRATGGAATDCQNDGTDTRANGNVSGIFPAGTAQLSLDLGHRPSGVFHDTRLAVLASAGQMPQLSFGQQEAQRATYTSWGLSLTLGLGADH